MSGFTYYLQDDASQSIRRYPHGSAEGERWDRQSGWVPTCAPQEACILTDDKVITEETAQTIISQPTQKPIPRP